MIRSGIAVALLASAVGITGCASRAETIGMGAGMAAGAAVGGGTMGNAAGRAYDNKHNND